MRKMKSVGVRGASHRVWGGGDFLNKEKDEEEKIGKGENKLSKRKREKIFLKY